jgi:hypothetical protein
LRRPPDGVSREDGVGDEVGGDLEGLVVKTPKA